MAGAPVAFVITAGRLQEIEIGMMECRIGSNPAFHHSTIPNLFIFILFCLFQKRREQIDRHREDRRGVLLRRDLCQGLKES